MKANELDLSIPQLIEKFDSSVQKSVVEILKRDAISKYITYRH